VVTWTSKNLAAIHKTPIDFGSLLKWIGLRLLIALDPIKGGIHHYWHEEGDPSSVQQEQA